MRIWSWLVGIGIRMTCIYIQYAIKGFCIGSRDLQTWMFFFILQSFLVKNYYTDYVGECTMVYGDLIKDIIWELDCCWIANCSEILCRILNILGAYSSYSYHGIPISLVLFFNCLCFYKWQLFSEVKDEKKWVCFP